MGAPATAARLHSRKSQGRARRPRSRHCAMSSSRWCAAAIPNRRRPSWPMRPCSRRTSRPRGPPWTWRFSTCAASTPASRSTGCSVPPGRACSPSATLGIEDDLAASLDRARRYVAEGFRILKIKVGETGSRRHGWSPRCALRSAARSSSAPMRTRATTKPAQRGFCVPWSRWGSSLLEQPDPATDFDVLRRLRAASTIPIMADESAVTEADATRVPRPAPRTCSTSS